MTTPRHLRNKSLALITGVTSLLLMQVTSAIILSPASTSKQSTFNWNPTSSALAAENKLRYTAPNRGQPQRTSGTGARGCNDGTPVGLNLLVPNDHVGLTSSGHPTFLWYLSQPPEAALEFSLVKPGEAQPLFVTQIQPESAGMVAMTLPEDLPALEPGEKYRWSVSVICNAQRRSGDVFAQAWIERVELPAAMAEQLKAATSEAQKAGIYAQAGYWFDALNAMYNTYTTQPENTSVKDAMLSLLEQGGLMSVVEKERERLASR